jgi:hypothetical protein
MSPTRFKLLNLRTLINIASYNGEHPLVGMHPALGWYQVSPQAHINPFSILFANLPSAKFVYRCRYAGLLLSLPGPSTWLSPVKLILLLLLQQCNAFLSGLCRICVTSHARCLT